MARVLVALRSRRLAFLSRALHILLPASFADESAAVPPLRRVSRDSRRRRSFAKRDASVLDVFFWGVARRLAATPRLVAAMSPFAPALVLELSCPDDKDSTQSAVAPAAVSRSVSTVTPPS